MSQLTEQTLRTLSKVIFLPWESGKIPFKTMVAFCRKIDDWLMARSSVDFLEPFAVMMT